MKSDRRPHPEQKQAQELGGRKILLGVTGGIAAYKAVELARLFMQAGARVQVIMTHAATKFVAPLTFETVTARTVYVEMFPEHGEPNAWHTEIATWADIAVIAPATADHLAKLACGLADDLLSTTLLAYEKRRVLCPAMNTRMWANPAVQENLNTLKRRGYRVIPPEDGEMARPGEEPGIGRLAEPQAIYQEVRHLLSAPQDLRGVRVLVTAGRTEESWDPVRVLTNRASGRMGYALAEEARERGADVMLISGPTDVVPPTGVKLNRIKSASELAQAVKRDFHNCNILLMSAAVSDYTFNQTAPNKIKKGEPDPKVHLIPTEDILKSISSNKGNRIIVGFALETENVLENALKKLREKHLDIVVANNPLAEGSGFQVETNQVFIIHRNGAVLDLPLQSKREVAREILNAVMELYRNPLPEPDVEPDITVDIEPEPDEDHGLIRMAGLDVEDLPPPKRAANGTPPPQRAIQQSGEQQQQQSGKKGKSRRGGRRVRERRERLAARSGQEPTQQAAPQQTPPPPAPRVIVTPPPAPASATAATETRKPESKKHHRPKKSKPTAPVEAPAPKAEQKPAPKAAVKKTPKKSAAKKATKKSAKPEKTEA